MPKAHPLSFKGVLYHVIAPPTEHTKEENTGKRLFMDQLQ